MRSSKSRSRSKNNRNRNTLGNVVNRVFDSSGPEGKVRGTPQQIIDKYNQLARDAALGNDRVAAENFQQHAEHYMRLLSEAQKEADQRREQQERENRERQAQRDRDRSDRDQPRGEGRGEGGQSGGSQQPEVSFDAPPPRQPEVEQSGLPGMGDQPDVLGGSSEDEDDSGLVETPESRAETKPKPRARRAKKDEGGAAPADAGAETQPAEKPKRPRKPRKKPEEAATDGGSASGAAE
ncbi:DUF4167 domain-containing protein [Salipiger mangrovisoli]|uniref:DUF4167 domain-containing protein n=1 Tax=Salipiger mangrovisoli TaxID=2865933 RepID=A0ABR9WVL3_9RHOB|nr:DUF4167 domain-containing protein [Salipiger mangrovisoli]MBE9635325.1 DUF4167 domain-containing protein [Salipiger mangrovisoli]